MSLSSRRLAHVTGVLLAAALAAVAGASAAPNVGPTQSFSITLDGKHVALSSAHWRPGTIRISATSTRGEQELLLMRFRPGYSYAQFQADGKKSDSRGPAGPAAYRRLMRQTEFLGGVDVFAGERAAFTATVHPGVYYLGELNSRPIVRRIRVDGPRAAVAPPARPAIEEYDFGYRVVNGPLPARGTITVRNVGNQPHRLNFEPLRAGTTKAELGAYLRKTGGRPYAPPPPFARNGPEFGTSLLGPGESMQYSYAVPSGTYGLISFQQDVAGGKPQALLGMYGVARLE